MHFREPHAGEQDGGPRSGAERDPTLTQRRKRHLRDEIDRQYWPVGPHGQIGQEQQLVRVSQVLQQRNRPDVEISPNERVVEPIRRVFGQLDVEQRARAHQSPVDRQAIQELDVSDARPRGCHRSGRLIAGSGPGSGPGMGRL